MSDWIKTADKLPEKSGRYLTLLTFASPCISNDSIVRKNIPFTCNYSPEKGWSGKVEEQEITHWMQIPEIPKDE